MTIAVLIFLFDLPVPYEQSIWHIILRKRVQLMLHVNILRVSKRRQQDLPITIYNTARRTASAHGLVHGAHALGLMLEVMHHSSIVLLARCR